MYFGPLFYRSTWSSMFSHFCFVIVDILEVPESNTRPLSFPFVPFTLGETSILLDSRRFFVRKFHVVLFYFRCDFSSKRVRLSTSHTILNFPTSLHRGPTNSLTRFLVKVLLPGVIPLWPSHLDLHSSSPCGSFSFLLFRVHFQLFLTFSFNGIDTHDMMNFCCLRLNLSFR